MKHLFVLIVMLAACTAVNAQQNQVLSAASSDCSVTNSCLVYGIDPTAGGATLTVSANSGGNTLQFEATGGGTLWVALNATPSNSSTAASSTTSTGTWQVNVAAYVKVRIRMSTQTSGNSTVSIITSTASARGGSGNGGGGTVTAVTGTSPIVSSGGITPAISCPSCVPAAVGPVINVKIPSVLCPGCTAFGNAQELNFNVSLSGTTITDTTDAPFQPTDVGKVAWAIFNGNGGGYSETTPAVTTIAGFTDSGHITLTNTAADASCIVNSCTFVWGNDDDVAIHAAVTAATSSNWQATNGNSFGPASSVIYMPCGGYIYKTNINLSPTQKAGPSLLGCATRQTVLFPRPDMSGSGSGASVYMVDNANGGFIRDIMFEGSSFLWAPGGAGYGLIVEHGSGRQIENLEMAHTPISNASAAINVTGTNLHIYDLHVHDAVSGGASYDLSNGACTFSGSNIDVYAGICSNYNQNLLILNMNNDKGGQRITFWGGVMDECGLLSAGTACSTVTNSDDVSFFGTAMWSQQNATAYPLSLTSNSVVRVEGVDIGPYCGSACTLGSSVVLDSTSRLIAAESKFRNYGAGHTLTGPGTYVDGGGNVYLAFGGLGNGFSTSGSPTVVTSQTHAANTCVDALASFAATTLCNQYLDQKLQVLRVLASSNATTTCATAPVVTLTNGTASQTLTLTTGAATWDSGATATIYGAGSTITVSVSAGSCVTPPTNLAVTFTYQSYGAS